jgi:hypothetical protein
MVTLILRSRVWAVKGHHNHYAKTVVLHRLSQSKIKFAIKIQIIIGRPIKCSKNFDYNLLMGPISAVFWGMDIFVSYSSWMLVSKLISLMYVPLVSCLLSKT